MSKMCRKLTLVIWFFIAGVQTIHCFSETSEHQDHEIRIRETGERGNFTESSYTDEPSDTEPNELHNPCWTEEPDGEQSSEEKNKSSVPTRKRRDQHRSDSIDTSQTSKDLKHTPGKFLLNDTSHRFSDHFLNCIHIGIESDWFKLLTNGSLHLPQLSRTIDKSEFCQNEDGMVFICDELHKNLSQNATTSKDLPDPYPHLSGEFRNCSGHIAIEKELYESRPNGSVYVPTYDRVFDYSNYLIGPNEELFICPVFFPKEEKFSRTFEIVTVTGLSISMLFIVLYMGFFAFMDSLRNLPGYCLFSLCLSLLMAYACFLIRSIGPKSDVCRDLILSIMYFFLAAFFWMNVLSFDVWRSLKMATSKLRLSSNSMMWKRFALYSLYAWLFPLSIVIFSIIVTQYGSDMEYLHLEFDQDLCWFSKKGALFAYMALPLIILMCLNAIFFTTSFVMITRASMNTTDNMATFWKRFCLFLKLSVIMGVAWIFGIIAAATNQPVLFFIFVILNTLQGVFIFFSFALSEKTKKVLRKKITARKTSVFPSQITSQPAQSVTSF